MPKPPAWKDEAALVGYVNEAIIDLIDNPGSQAYGVSALPSRSPATGWPRLGRPSLSSSGQRGIDYSRAKRSMQQRAEIMSVWRGCWTQGIR